MPVSYDRLSEHYDKSRWADHATVELLRRTLQVTTGSRVLDIGCGTGNFAQAFRGGGVNVTALDSSIGMLREACRKDLGGVLLCGDATLMPFEDGPFDGAYAIQMLHHIEEKNLLFAEAARTLRLGGTLAVQSCSHAQLETFWCFHYFPAGLEIDRNRIPDTSSIARLFKEAGFDSIQSCPCPMDEFLEDYPAQYLDESYRAGQSTFALMSPDDIETGCQQLKADIASGVIDEITSYYLQKALEVGGRVTLTYGKLGRRVPSCA